ncbi:hypothetical protein A2U01_0021629, partial [Trifolium medium]|nr:hypothetical protein [Trifolium medium]
GQAGPAPRDHFSFGDEYKKDVCANEVVFQRKRVVEYNGWKPLKLNFVKLNTYCACSDGKRAGCGGVIRSTRGMTWRLGFSNVEVSIDSKVVVQVIKTRRVQGFANYPLVKKIHNMLNMEWNVEFGKGLCAVTASTQ